uniref:Ig-like domain-containing protein n=1 Tax=Cyclopterus lumpus TaxID=8103 RepID=A0A8C3AG32_CYCLU
MGITSLCLMLSTLVLHPDRSQFFSYDSITLTCGEAGNSGGWTLKRNTSFHTSQMCDSDWGVSSSATASSCVIEDAYPLDSGVYWCQSALGENGRGVNVTVTDGDVILESPGLPVTEGDEVTLLCSSKGREATPGSSATFYKDGVPLGAPTAGSVTFPKVSESDEGFYACELPAGGRSPPSWLAVNGNDRVLFARSVHVEVSVSIKSYEHGHMRSEGSIEAISFLQTY